jgi:hypothetical protein
VQAAGQDEHEWDSFPKKKPLAVEGVPIGEGIRLTAARRIKTNPAVTAEENPPEAVPGGRAG